MKRPTRGAYLLLIVAMAFAMVVATRDMTNEGAVSVQGDMPRHLVNGAFLLDLLAVPDAWTPSGVRTFAERYFARYPALSLGHHPPLLPILLVPAYALFGVSVWTARIVIVVCFEVSVWLLFALVRRLYDEWTAAWAALLLVTSPFLTIYAQAVMAEMPTIMCVLFAWRRLLRFRDTGRLRDYLLFVAAALVSLTAKQVTLFAFPAYVVPLADRHGRALLMRPDIRRWTIVGGTCTLLIGVLTLALSPFNASVVLDTIAGQRGVSSLSESLRAILEIQLRPPLAIAAATGALVAMLQLDKKVTLALFWITFFIGGVPLLIGPYEPERYSIAALPAYCVCGAMLATLRTGRARIFAGLLLVGVVGLQGLEAWRVRPIGAEGYEAAALAVLNGQSAPAVLYSSSRDTGYFVFFMRKHEKDGRRIAVLRANKLLTTSLVANQSLHDRVSDPTELYPLLRRFGVRYVVLEDRESGTRMLDALRTELTTDRFIARHRIPLRSTDARLSGVSLVVYEYRDVTPQHPDAVIDIELPIVGQRLRVALIDALASGR